MSRWIVLGAVLTIACISLASAQVAAERGGRRCDAIPNLLIGIQSENEGLRLSSAYYLGEYKCPNAVLPLMRILKDSDKESARIVAALALCRIGEARGVYAVKEAVHHDESEKVRVMCAWFYNEYYKPGTFAFIPKAAAAPVLAAE